MTQQDAATQQDAEALDPWEDDNGHTPEDYIVALAALAAPRSKTVRLLETDALRLLAHIRTLSADPRLKIPGGYRVVADATVPRDEIHWRDGEGNLLGKITGVRTLSVREPDAEMWAELSELIDEYGREKVSSVNAYGLTDHYHEREARMTRAAIDTKIAQIRALAGVRNNLGVNE